MRKAGSSRWKGVQQLTNEAPNQQAQSPLPGEESEIGRDRGTDQTVTLVAIHSSATEKRAASDSKMRLRIWVRMGR